MQQANRSRWLLDDSDDDDDDEIDNNAHNNTTTLSSSILDKTQIRTPIQFKQYNTDRTNNVDLNQTQRLLDIMNNTTKLKKTKHNKNNNTNDILDISLLNTQVNNIINSSIHKNNIYVPNTKNNTDDLNNKLSSLLQRTTNILNNNKHSSTHIYNNNIKQYIQSYQQQLYNIQHNETQEYEDYIEKLKHDYTIQIDNIKQQFLRNVQHKTDELNSLLLNAKNKYNNRVNTKLNNLIHKIEQYNKELNTRKSKYNTMYDNESDSDVVDDTHVDNTLSLDNTQQSMLNTTLHNKNHNNHNKTVYFSDTDIHGYNIQRRASVIHPVTEKHVNNNKYNRSIFFDSDGDISDDDNNDNTISDTDDNNDKSLHLSHLSSTKKQINKQKQKRFKQMSGKDINTVLNDSDSDSDSDSDNNNHTTKHKQYSKHQVSHYHDDSDSQDEHDNEPVDHHTNAYKHPLSHLSSFNTSRHNNTTNIDTTRSKAALLSKSFRKRLLQLQKH